jgi:hypothetical protein
METPWMQTSLEINLQNRIGRSVAVVSKTTTRQSREMLAAPISMVFGEIVQGYVQGWSASQCVKKVESLQHMLAQSKAMNLPK